MGDGYVIKNVLVWTASKLGDLAAQLAKQHVDIIDMVYTGCLDYATPVEVQRSSLVDLTSMP